MISSQTSGTTNHVSDFLEHMKVQSDHFGDLSTNVDMIKSVNNPEAPPNTGSCMPDFRNDGKITTFKTLSQTCVIDNSPICLSHLEQCFVATDTEREGNNEAVVEYIKVEADPLEIGNIDTGSAEDSVQVFSDSVTCESPTSKLLYRLLTSDKRCVYSAHTSDTPSETLHYGSKKKVEDKTVIDNLGNKCHKNSVSKEGESDIEEVQDTTATQFQGGIRYTTASSKQSERYLCCYVDRPPICNCLICCSLL